MKWLGGNFAPASLDLWKRFVRLAGYHDTSQQVTRFLEFALSEPTQSLPRQQIAYSQHLFPCDLFYMCDIYLQK